MAAILLVLVLAVQSLATDRYHRDLTEEVLRDYAALAADEALRRTTQEVGYYGYTPAFAVLRSAVLSPGIDLATALSSRHLRSGASERGAAALDLVHQSFALHRGTKRLFGELRAPLSIDLLDLIDTVEFDQQGFASVLIDGPEHAQTVVLSLLGPNVGSGAEDGGEASGPDIIGFLVNPVAMRRMISSALERSPLLPLSLGDGAIDNSVVSLELFDGAGQQLFSSTAPSSNSLLVERKPSDFNGVIKGLTARAAIDPDAAHRLVIGGLPKSRLPFLLTLFLLTTGLLTGAILMIRRERALIQLRTDFVARVSHELRTPLAQIRMFAETLRLGRVRSDDERQHYLEILDREAGRLTGLVENILRFSRSGREAQKLNPRPVAIAELLERLRTEMAPRLSACESSLLAAGELEVSINVDPDAAHQILLNLVDNALKHGPDSQNILIQAETLQSKVRITVEDEGPGISARDRERVWRDFERGGSSSSSGTGIGLAVVRDLMLQHGGRCWINAEARCSSVGTQVVLEFDRAHKGAR